MFATFSADSTFLTILVLSDLLRVKVFCSTPPESHWFIITNPVLHTGLLKFDYSVVLELQLEFAREALATYNKLNRLKQ